MHMADTRLPCRLLISFTSIEWEKPNEGQQMVLNAKRTAKTANIGFSRSRAWGPEDPSASRLEILKSEIVNREVQILLSFSVKSE